MDKKYGLYYTRWVSLLTRRQKERLVTMNMLCTYVFYIVYPLLLLYVVFFQRHLLMKTLILPAILFVIFSLLRKSFQRKRPYETFPITPLIQKKSTGNSFPSRHIFSASLIGCICLYFNTVLGGILLCIAFVGAIVRVLCGVHYVSDVVVGYVVGFLCGLLFFL